MYNWNGLMVIFTLYFDAENVPKSSENYDQNKISQLLQQHCPCAPGGLHSEWMAGAMLEGKTEQ